MARGTARFLAAALLWFGVWIVTPPEAEGHAALRLSTPADGEVFDEPPDSVTLSFTEPPELSLSVVEVVDVDGRSFHRGPLEVIAPDRLTISQPLAELPDGTYTTTWKVISQIDGHTSAGAFAFGVGVSALEAPPTVARTGGDAAPLSPLEVVGRWLLVAGLVILVGGTATAVAAFGEPPGAVRWLAGGDGESPSRAWVCLPSLSEALRVWGSAHLPEPRWDERSAGGRQRSSRPVRHWPPRASVEIGGGVQ